MKPLVVIPARGGSKRIPRKNITDINGSPALGILVSKLLAFGIFDEVVVSTDDSEIASIATEYGASVSLRLNPVLSDDLTPAESVVRNYLEDHNLSDSTRPVFCVYPLALLLERQNLEDSLILLSEYPDKFVFAAGLLEPNPLRHTFTVEGGSVKVIFPEHNFKRSQDLEHVYFDVGMFYLAKAKVWMDPNRYWYNNNAQVVIIPRENSIDVDTPDDLQRLISKFKDNHDSQ